MCGGVVTGLTPRQLPIAPPICTPRLPAMRTLQLSTHPRHAPPCALCPCWHSLQSHAGVHQVQGATAPQQTEFSFNGCAHAAFRPCGHGPAAPSHAQAVPSCASRSGGSMAAEASLGCTGWLSGCRVGCRSCGVDRTPRLPACSRQPIQLPDGRGGPRRGGGCGSRGHRETETGSEGCDAWADAVGAERGGRSAENVRVWEFRGLGAWRMHGRMGARMVGRSVGRSFWWF